MKATILAIVGESGSGKTTLAKHLETRGIPALVSYTTRPKRDGEVDGVDHWFVDDSQVPPITDTLAYTLFGGFHYWTSPWQIDKPLMSYIVDEKGLIELLEKWSGRFNVVSILVQRPNNPIDGNRRMRDTEREALPLGFYDIRIVNGAGLDAFFEAAWQALQVSGIV